MPIGTSLYCKRCEKILAGGHHGNWSKLPPGYNEVCICVRPVTENVDGKTATGITLNPLLTLTEDLKAGTSTSNDSSWRPKEDRFFVSNVTDLRPKSRTEQERNNGREKERKYRVLDLVSLGFLNAHIQTLFSDVKTEYGTSLDIFWTNPNVDFIRLRQNTKELTYKLTDKKDITDRQEVNLIIDDFPKARKWMTKVHGAEKGANNTSFYIYYLPTAEITIYEVMGYDQVFLEIEAGNVKEIDKFEKELKQTIKLSQEFKSLFQILFGVK